MELHIAALRRAEWRVEAALPNDGPLFAKLQSIGIRCHELPIERRLDARAGILVGELVRRNSFEIVHVQTPKAGMLVRKAARSAGAKVINHEHGSGTRGLLAAGILGPLERAKKSALLALEMMADRHTDRFILESVEDLRALRHPAEKTELLYNGIDSSQWPVAPMPLEPIILFPARLSVQKDPFTLLEASASLLRSGMKFRVELAGGGEIESEVRRRVASLGIEDRVSYLGGAYSGPSLYARSSVVALTTHFEGQPFAVLEAMASGRAVIATHCGAIPETLGESGVIVSPRDIPAVADGLRRLLSDPALSMKLGAMARLRVETQFSLAEMEANLIEIYRRTRRGGN